VREKVATALCDNASEVIREALRPKIAHEETDSAQWRTLLDAVGLGRQQAERGEFADYPLESSLARLGSEA